MFQTELNLWLQAQGSSSVIWVMWFVSEIGREQVYMLLLVFLTFGVDLRRGSPPLPPSIPSVSTTWSGPSYWQAS